MPTRARRAQPGEQSGLYNRATCFEFHQLLVSTLLRFGKALDGYAAAKSFEDLVQRAKEVNRSGTLLWYIGYSRILENHLKVLHTNKLLNLPVNTPQHLETFFTFTGFARTKKHRLYLGPPTRLMEVRMTQETVMKVGAKGSTTVGMKHA
jgi:hypothetical protein